MKTLSLLTTKGWARVASVLVVGVAACSMLMPVATQAAKHDPTAPITETDYLKWLVQITDSRGQLPPNPTTGDYIHWANDQGIKPPGGWKADHVLTKEILAKTLCQLFKIKATDGNYESALARLGIPIPDCTTVNRCVLVLTISGKEFDLKAAQFKKCGSPIKPPPGKDDGKGGGKGGGTGGGKNPPPKDPPSHGNGGSGTTGDGKNTGRK